jgi:hypothetical protein
MYLSVQASAAALTKRVVNVPGAQTRPEHSAAPGLHCKENTQLQPPHALYSSILEKGGKIYSDA